MQSFVPTWSGIKNLASSIYKKGKVNPVTGTNLIKPTSSTPQQYTANVSIAQPQSNIANAMGGVRAPAPTTPAPKPTTPTQKVVSQLASNQSQKSADQLAREQLAKENYQYQPASTPTVAASPVKMATVYNPNTGDRKAVPVGSQDAQKYFGQGYILENKKAPQPAEPLKSSTPAPSSTIPTPAPNQPASTPVDKTQQSIQELRDLIVKAMTPSGQEQSLIQQLNNLQTGTAANAAALEGQGKGLTIGQVQGQQGALLRTAAAQEMPLQAELDRLESARQAAIQAGNVQLGYLIEDQKNQLAQQQQTQSGLQALALKAAQAGASPEEVQGILSSTDLGQALLGATKAGILNTPAQTNYETLSPGQTLYDPATGKAIYTAPKEGGGGNYDEPLSVTEAKALGVPYGTTRGEAYGLMPQETAQEKALSAESAKLKANVQTGLDDVAELRKYSQERIGTGRLFNNKYKAAEKDLVDIIGRLRSGGAITKEESDSFQELLPKTFELESTRQEKLDRIENLLNRTLSGVSAGGGGGNQRGDALDGVLDEIGFNNALSTAVKGSVQIPQSSRLAYVNNNPGNLRFAGQSGATQGEGGFARFSSPEAGYQALLAQIGLDAGRGLTLAQFINKYAPPTENNTSQYLQQLMNATGANHNTPISQIDRNTLGRAIALKESSTRIG